MSKIDEAINLLNDFGNPKKWELLGGHYYRCRGKSNAKTNKWPHEIIQEAIDLLESEPEPISLKIGEMPKRPITSVEYAKALEKKIDSLTAELKAKDKALDIARKALNKASMMYFRDLGGIDKMIAEQDVLIEQALKGP